MYGVLCAGAAYAYLPALFPALLAGTVWVGRRRLVGATLNRLIRAYLYPSSTRGLGVTRLCGRLVWPVRFRAWHWLAKDRAPIAGRWILTAGLLDAILTVGLLIGPRIPLTLLLTFVISTGLWTFGERYAALLRGSSVLGADELQAAARRDVSHIDHAIGSASPGTELVLQERLYLGVREDSTDPHWSNPDDCCGMVGPPGAGKTSALLIPQALIWKGSLVSTSVKPDVLRATAAWRREVAYWSGGDVYVYAPTDPRQLIHGVRNVRWSPLAGCDDPTIANLRAKKLLESSGAAGSVENASHWKNRAEAVLQAYFQAAALEGLGMQEVHIWLLRQEIAKVAAILRHHSAARGSSSVAAGLESVGLAPERERGSIFSAAAVALSSMANPEVMDSTNVRDGAGFDIRRFLSTPSALYIVSPTDHQEAVAPLISTLVEEIVRQAQRLADQQPNGRLKTALLLLLDEMANIAPLPTIDNILSTGRAQGILVSWAAQSLSQLRYRWGAHKAATIWGVTRAKVLFGGIADVEDLEAVSKLVGDHEVWEESFSSTQGTSAGGGPTSGSSSSNSSSMSRQKVRKPILPVNELRQIPDFHAIVLQHNLPPLRVVVRRADEVRPFADLREFSESSPIMQLPPVAPETAGMPANPVADAAVAGDVLRYIETGGRFPAQGWSPDEIRARVLDGYTPGGQSASPGALV